MYCDVLFTIPSNTCISVPPPLKVETTPVALAANVCDSFVKNAVTASIPSVPSVPSVPGVPSVPSEPGEPGEPLPSAPPSTLKIEVESFIESLVTEIDNGKSDLFVKSVNAILPLICPLPFDTTPPNDGVVN